MATKNRKGRFWIIMCSSSTCSLSLVSSSSSSLFYFISFIADGSNANLADQDLHSLTVERLRALLKERGLPQRGKKVGIISST